MTDVRVCTYNVHWGIGMDGRLDLDRVADVIERIEPDAIAVQELDRNRRPETEYADQLSTLSNRLGMDAAYGVTIEEEPTAASDGEPRQYGIAVLTPGTVIDSEFHDLSHPDGTEPRVLLRSRVALADVEFTLYATHLGLGADERTEQAEEILDATADAGQHVFAGDLNATPDSPPLQRLSERYVDAVAAADGAEPTYPAPYAVRDPEDEHVDDFARVYVPNRRIDHVLVTPGIEPLAADVRHSLASDHCPVVSDLRLPD